MMYQCSYGLLTNKCKFKNNDKTEILNHICCVHSNDANFRIKCFIPNCKSYFCSYIKLKTHIEAHSNNVRRIKCDWGNCQKSFSDINKLYQCYYDHINNNLGGNPNRKCFYKDCTYKISNQLEAKRNFSAHLSQYHNKEGKSAKLLNENCLLPIFEESENNGIMDAENDENYNRGWNDEINNENEQCEPETYESKYFLKKAELEHFYQRLYLKFKDKYLISKFKCDEIFSHIEEFIRINNSAVIDLIDHCQTMYKPDKTLEIIVENLLTFASMQLYTQ